MISLNINTETAVPLIVGVGSTILAVLLMLIKIPNTDYSSKLTNSKMAIIVSFLICSFMMFYTMAQYGQPDIWDWGMFMMIAIYIVVHFSTCIISYSMIALLKSEKHKSDRLFIPGLFVSVLVAFLLLESYKSENLRYFGFVCIIALMAMLIQSIIYIIYFDKAYKHSLRELESYYDEDESHKMKWVRFCYIIAMLTNIFFIVYLALYMFLDYKLEVASLYTVWYLLYMLYLTSNFISFIGSHKLILEAFAHKTLSGEDFIQKRNQKRKGRKQQESLPASAARAEFLKLEKALDKWVEEKRYCEYDKSREEIARELNTSKELLHHYFTTVKGVDFMTWRTHRRIEEAKRLLVGNKDISVNIVAELSGFSDRSNFHRQFVKIVGCSPKQWRDSGE